MPVEILELLVKARIDDKNTDSHLKQDQPTQECETNTAAIEEAIEQFSEVLNRKNER